MSGSPRIALVTGGNKGIGFAIVRALCKQFGDGGVVYIGSRDEGRGQDAVKQLKKEGLNPKFLQLDINSNDQIENAAKFFKDTHGGLDVLVNNAAIAFKAAATEPNSVQAPVTIETNVFATLRLSQALIPLVRSGGRVVNVASMAGKGTYSKLSDEMKKRFREVDTEQGVVDLMNEFISAAKESKQTERGWSMSNYGVSKLGLIALTRIQGQAVSKETSKPDVMVNSCCPGWVKTDMSGNKGGKPIDEGAVTPVYLALLPQGSAFQGKFFENKKEVNFW